MREIKIAPSFLSADFSRAGEEIRDITANGADLIHLDVMDGNFVKNISFGPKFIEEIRPYSKAIFDSHLMILNPWNYIDRFAKAGSDIITVHYEACGDRLIDTLKAIKSLGVKCGAVINPATPAEALVNAVDYCDMILVMSVVPGFGGQKFMPEVLPKLEKINQYIISSGKDIDLQIDGGINLENIGLCKKAGANVFVAGSTIYAEKDRAGIIKKLREI